MAPNLIPVFLYLLFFFFFFFSLTFFHCEASNNEGSSLRRCDLTAGRWVYDQSYPLYNSTNCPYLSTRSSCQANGRPDAAYEKWKWQPNSCSIPRFDALNFLGRMRRKRVMMVGDSIMKNQWESLACLVQGVIPTPQKKLTYNGPCIALHALDFEASIEFCWAPLLVELKKDPNGKRVLFVELIEENAKYWRGVDVLVFDSAHWWTHSDQWDLVMEGGTLYTNMHPMVAYGKGLSTWANWVDRNLNPTQTRVVFRSVSPMHNRFNGRRCNNQREPVTLTETHHVSGHMRVLKMALGGMRFPVYLQDITTMTTLRRDGHPSLYWKPVLQQQQPSSDCSHWCLPGVPDSWNEMLSAILLNSGL